MTTPALVRLETKKIGSVDEQGRTLSFVNIADIEDRVQRGLEDLYAKSTDKKLPPGIRSKFEEVYRLLKDSNH